MVKCQPLSDDCNDMVLIETSLKPALIQVFCCTGHFADATGPNCLY